MLLFYVKQCEVIQTRRKSSSWA